jgi:hypothetical protein
MRKRLIWLEIGNGRDFVILPVHGIVFFYRDGDEFTVFDSKAREHKFELIHLEIINAK